MLSGPLTDFEMQMYYENKSKLNDVYSRKTLPKIKDVAFEINLDK